MVNYIRYPSLRIFKITNSLISVITRSLPSPPLLLHTSFDPFFNGHKRSGKLHWFVSFLSVLRSIFCIIHALNLTSALTFDLSISPCPSHPPLLSLPLLCSHFIHFPYDFPVKSSLFQGKAKRIFSGLERRPSILLLHLSLMASWSGTLSSRLGWHVGCPDIGRCVSSHIELNSFDLSLRSLWKSISRP